MVLDTLGRYIGYAFGVFGVAASITALYYWWLFWSSGQAPHHGTEAFVWTVMLIILYVLAGVAFKVTG